MATVSSDSQQISVEPTDTAVVEQQQQLEESQSAEEQDDLFGDDSDDDDDEAIVTSKKSHGIDAASSSENEDDDEADDYRSSKKKANDDDNEEEEEEEEEEDIKRAELTLPRHPKSHKPIGDVFSFNLPRFLFVDAEPFSPNNFESQLSDFISESKKKVSGAKELQDSIEFKKLELQNTIRWRYAQTETNELYKQSNSRIVEWEDGSLSLQIGNEFFDIKPKSNEGNILAFQGGQVLMSSINLNKAIQVLPSSMNSKSHRILATTLQSNLKMKKNKRINTIVTKEDPEAKAREFEKAQKEIERARRRQLAKLQQQEDRLERKSGGSSLNTTTKSRSRGIRNDIDVDGEEDDDEAMEDGYDEADDFVVSDGEEDSGLDEDELDAAAEKLRRVKRDGAEKYKTTTRTRTASPEEEEEEEDEDGAVVRKKRRIVLED
ncbi:hypothetical protein CANARDRAFT_28660, partial [[Candida] arabinofermentans NRRL YB-2248]